MEALSSKIIKESIRSAYRPDIDGMRALAILYVVIFHAFPSLMQGGFVGVDIFFVISGFLISSIIFRGLKGGDFSFARFYSHRVKRIFPALLVVLFSCYFVGWFVLLPDEFSQLGKHIAAGAGYVQNFVLSSEAGYFDTASELKPLTHLWSLAIEEQFYLIYPVVIWGAWRLGINIFTVVIVMALLSFSVNVHGIYRDAISTFFAPQARFWELLAGAVLAYLDLYKRERVFSVISSLVFHPVFFHNPPLPERREAVLRNVLSVSGLLLIIVSALWVRKGFSFPGWWALGPVLGAFLLIFAGPYAWVNRKLLANPLMVFVGVISYPLYLWHWPILSFAHIVAGHVPSLEVRAAAVSLSVLLAWVTYRLVEKPIRFGGQSRIKTVMLVVLSLVVGVIGYYTFRHDGFVRGLERFAKVSKAAGEWGYPGRLTHESYNGIDYLVQPSQGQSSTLFVGDSNIEQYYPRVEEFIKNSPGSTRGAIFKTGGGCFPVPGMSYDQAHSHCGALMSQALELARGKPGVENVVIGGQWNGYLSTGYGLVDTVEYGSERYKISLANLSSYIRELVALKKSVYVVLNIPTGEALDPKFIAQRRLENFPSVFQMRDGGVDTSVLVAKYGMIQTDLARVAVDAGARVIDPIEFLCDARCDSLDAEGEPMYKDAFHLRPTFVRQHATFVDQTVQY
ncbi:acyltransferase [Pseudomonas sp. LS1212]|uniref:acyltransferase family protein n=1 Tax=Pseudomonas sp. LS1212 TaxID=2972478 RepID=UPI00215C5B37|nr:acyltransferase family protein [Pseudomonas sp. LS1212]UVJ42786.1 acyltransferase [Pseudomonas sp. LS1212]